MKTCIGSKNSILTAILSSTFVDNAKLDLQISMANLFESFVMFRQHIFRKLAARFDSDRKVDSPLRRIQRFVPE
jgi:hypothetical protein